MTYALLTFLVSLSLGVLVSLCGGHYVVEIIVVKLQELGRVHKRLLSDGTEQERARSEDEHRFTVLLGLCERLAIMLIAMFSLQGAGVFTLAWMGLKLASHWNRPGRIPVPSGDKKEPEPERIAREENLRREARGALSSLVGSLISAGFGFLGAVIACGKWLFPLLGVDTSVFLCPGFC